MSLPDDNQKNLANQLEIQNSLMVIGSFLAPVTLKRKAIEILYRKFDLKMGEEEMSEIERKLNPTVIPMPYSNLTIQTEANSEPQHGTAVLYPPRSLTVDLGVFKQVFPEGIQLIDNGRVVAKLDTNEALDELVQLVHVYGEENYGEEK